MSRPEGDTEYIVTTTVIMIRVMDMFFLHSVLYARFYKFVHRFKSVTKLIQTYHGLSLMSLLYHDTVAKYDVYFEIYRNLIPCGHVNTVPKLDTNSPSTESP